MKRPALINQSREAVEGVAGFTPEVDALLQHAADLRPVVAGEKLFLQGGPYPGIIRLMSGVVRFYASGENGREFLLGQIPAGHWFGHQQALDELPNPCDAVAVTDGRIATIPPARLNVLLAERPEIWREIGRVLSLRTRLILDWSIHMATLPFDRRLAGLLLSLMTVDDDGASRIKLAQEEIAAHLGVSRQTVNRQLKLWEAQAWIRVGYGAIVVDDARGLASVAG